MAEGKIPENAGDNSLVELTDKVNNKKVYRNPWAWVPSLYFAEGIPYVIVMTLSVVMYKKMGISNTDIAFFTSLLYFPWFLKFLWSPFVDMFKTKRFWVTSTQLFLTISFIGAALVLNMPSFLMFTLIIFGIAAFASATHDIAADGFYMLGLDQQDQSAFVGIRSTFYRLAMITGQGALVVLAGSLESHVGIPGSWMITFLVIALIFGLLFVYHKFILPYPQSDKGILEGKQHNLRKPFAEFIQTFVIFVKKLNIWVVLAFLFFYRFAEAQLVKLVSPFLLDPVSKGGLGLTTSEFGIAYGTVGIIALTVGGLLGGYVISKDGLRKWLWPMVLIMHLPDLVFVYLSQFQPANFLLINTLIAVEQFGYGFGFTAYMMFMIMISEGEHKTSHYAICTAFMALGMMLPGMFSGWLQDLLGYKNFFIWVMLSTIPGFIVAALIKVDPEFGRKKNV